MELDLSSPAEDPSGASNCNNNYASLDISAVVPNNNEDDEGPSNTNPKAGRVAGTKQCWGHSGEEPTLVDDHMACKWHCLQELGYTSETIKLMLELTVTTHKLCGYSGPQHQYIAWVKDRKIDPMVPNPAQVTNWLASGVNGDGKWEPTTVKTYFKVVKQLYDDRSSFNTDQHLKEFMAAVKGASVKWIRELEVDLTATMTQIAEQDITTIDFKTLSAHLCWMLLVIACLCPDSICCINLADPAFEIKDDAIILPIHQPKETQGGHPISWSLTLRAHTNPCLCPVVTLKEYLHQIKDFPCSIPHHKELSEFYTPLIQHSKHLSQPVKNDTISNHAKALGTLLPLPPGMAAPCGHAVGTTAAFQSGATVDNIFAYAHWSLAALFEKYYQLGSKLGTNFTMAILHKD
ncbi:hypothetical protein CPB97_003959 [Podila verticillata]|nr:hypothetical protein CPB97_003959 [Podila verticillata]